MSCPGGSTPNNGMCGNAKATATTTCAVLPPAVGSYVPTTSYITNVDHVKVASFANPISSCPAGDSSCNTANYGIIAAASNAPLKNVIYGIQTDLTPTNPSFPAEFFTANTECTAAGSTCNYIGADFSTNVMTEYSTLPYVVDNAFSTQNKTRRLSRCLHLPLGIHYIQVYMILLVLLVQYKLLIQLLTVLWRVT